jgi:hypothetical protein
MLAWPRKWPPVSQGPTQQSAPSQTLESTRQSTQQATLQPPLAQTPQSSSGLTRSGKGGSARASTGMRRIVLEGSAPPKPRPTVEQHAEALLTWLLEKKPDLAGHFVPVTDLKDLYAYLCRWRRWKPYKWNTLAKCLRELTGGMKTYGVLDGKRVRTYLLPTEGQVTSSAPDSNNGGTA